MNILLVLLILINVEFSWDAQADTTGYKVGTSTAAGGPYTYVDVSLPPTAAGRVAYLWLNWDATTKKYVVVTAYNAIGESDPSVEIAVGEPASPKNPRAVKK
jgi:hypothetical protein